MITRQTSCEGDMAIQVKLINSKHQFSTMTLDNGSSLVVKSGDTVKLLSSDNFQAVRKGNDLIIKNAKGEQFVLKDYYTNARNVDEERLFSLKEELGETKGLFSADLSDQVKLAELDTEVASDAGSAGYGSGNSSAVNSGNAAVGAGGISTGMAIAGFGALAVGGVAVASSGSGGSSSSSGGMVKYPVNVVPDENNPPTNVAPVITSGNSATVAENTTGVVYQAVATDPNGDSITYSLSGTDAGWFNIDAKTGAVSFKNAPDYEAHRPPTDGSSYIAVYPFIDNTYDIKVIASDGKLSAEKAVTITVTNVDDHVPSDIVLLGNPIFGTQGNDRFDGTPGIDYIYGFGGDDVFNNSPGRDVLTGGSGRDVYNYELGFVEADWGGYKLGFAPDNVDTIMDFVSGEDTIGFNDGSVLLGVSSLRISDDLFVQGPGAVAIERNDFFVFDTDTGALYYDYDGSGSEQPYHFATLYGVSSLQASDIMIYGSLVV